MMDAKIVTAEEVKVQIETLQGPQGERGAQGPQGERGERGPQGIQGPAGARGEKGDRGERGEKGATGERGPQGLPGRDGADGRDGAAGARGPQGAQGLQGERGEPGPAGRDGVDGIQGFSPIVDLERLDDGVLITVQNKDGNKIAKVFDGKNAENKLEDIFIIHFNEYVNASQEPIEEIINAIDAGKAVIGVTPSGVIYEYAGLKTYINKASETAHTFQTHIDPFNRNATSRFTQIKTDNSDFISSGQDISAKNPYKLILSGAVKAEYDGSKQVNITIPEGDTGGELFIVRYDPATKLADKTQAQIRAAVAQKTPCIALDSAGRVYSYVGEEAYSKDKNVLVPTFRHAMDYDEAGNVSFRELQIPGSGEMSIWGNTKVKAPNPKTLWIKGSGISALYDGSEQVTITLPEGGGSSGGLPEGGEPHRMLVTDGEGNTKWEERTHWKEDGVIDYFPAAKVSFEGGFYNIATPFAQPLVEGETYTVTINGVDHVSVAESFNNNGNIFLLLGNGSAFGIPDTGEPFGLLYVPPELLATTGGAYGLLVGDMGGASEVTLRVWSGGVIYHKLSPDFLPIETTTKKGDVLPETMAESGGDGAPITIATPFAAQIVAGKTYTVTYNGEEYKCTAFETPIDEDGALIAPVVGNQAALGGEDTGEPFLIAQVPWEMVEALGGYGLIVDLTGASSARVRIYGDVGLKIGDSALDMDWLPRNRKAGETILPLRTIRHELLQFEIDFAAMMQAIGEKTRVLVFVDGAYYETNVIPFGDEVVLFGNAGLISPTLPNTGEPFLIAAENQGILSFAFASEPESGLHQMAMYHIGETQTLPARLPLDYQQNMTPVTFIPGQVMELSAEEVNAAFLSGRQVYCCVNGKVEDRYPMTEHCNHTEEKWMEFRRFKDGEEQVHRYDWISGEWTSSVNKVLTNADIDSIADAVIAKIPSAEGVGF